MVNNICTFTLHIILCIYKQALELYSWVNNLFKKMIPKNMWKPTCIERT